MTGSSEGIGRAYAQELASKGLNIILISKGENRLSRAAEEIRKNFDRYVYYERAKGAACLVGLSARNESLP